MSLFCRNKRYISLLLCLLLVLSLMPAAFAEEGDDDIILIEGEDDPATGVGLDELGEGLIPIVEGEPASTVGTADPSAVSRTYGRLVLDVDWALIEQVDHQEGGEACACFALAYCRTMLDGRPHQYGEYNIGTVEHAYCSWTLGSYQMNYSYDLNASYELAFSELCSGNPVVVCVTGTRSTQHYVAIVGYENAVSGQPLSAANFLIIDSVAPYYELENMAAVGYDFKLTDNGYQVNTDTTSASVSYEANRSSYLSRCTVRQSSRSLRTTKSTELRSLPCSSSVDADSSLLTTLSYGSSFHAEAIVRNAAGDYWYKGRSSSGVRGYAYAAQFGAGEESFDDISLEELNIPTQLTPGNPFYISGKISTYNNILAAVRVAVYAGADTGASPLMAAETWPDLKFYSLKYSDIANALDFRTLGTGYYTFVLTVRCRNYYSTDGMSLLWTEPETELIRQGFTVGTVSSFTVSYNANGGSGAPAAQTKKAGTDLTLSSTRPTRSGYRFLGWATNSAAAQAEYQPGGLYTANASAVLYAVWEPITEKPTIVTQPASQTVAVGGTAVFSLTASGDGLSYQWYFRKSSSDSWSKCTGAGCTTGSIAIEGKSYRSGYQYRCAVKNKAGTVYSNAATLTLLSKPEIRIQPKGQVIFAGQTAQFNVVARGESLSYQWYFDNGSGTWSKCSGTGATSAALSVEGKSYRSGYLYRCRVSNAAGYVYTYSAMLVVNEKPKLTAQPKGMTAYPGDSVSFSVSASGEGLSYQWYFCKPGTSVWNACSGTGCKTRTYSLTAKDYHNGYQYCCRVSNGAGSVWSSAAALKVYQRPVITYQQQNMMANPGTTVTFRVAASSELAMSYQWYFRKNSDDAWSKCTGDSAKTPNLYVGVKPYRDGYEYRCAVTNAAGTSYSEPAMLIIIPVY